MVFTEVVITGRKSEDTAQSAETSSAHDIASVGQDVLQEGLRSATRKQSEAVSGPLSFPQQRLWFLDRLDPGAPLYNIVHSIHLEGALDIGVLQRCLNDIIARHKILRTTFASDGDGPIQIVAPHAPLTLPVTDLEPVPASARAAEILRLTNEEARQRFNLETGPMLRARLLRLGRSQHTLLLAVHHIVFDNWSEKVLADELSALYAAYRNGEASPLPELQAHYIDYAAAQRAKQQTAELDRALAYWKTKLGGPVDGAVLPMDRPEPAVRTFQGDTVAESIPVELVTRLRELGAEPGNLFVTLLAGFTALLGRYTGQQSVTIGVPTLNRPLGTEQLIGFFVNTLPIQTDLSNNPTFPGLVERVGNTVREAIEHQGAPFEKLVEILQPERALSRNPLFRVMFVFQDAPLRKLVLPGLEVQAEEFFSSTAKFDLTMFVTETEDGLQLRIEYSTDLFDQETIRRAMRHYRHLLESAVAQPDARLAELEVLDPIERSLVLEAWNATDADYPHQLCVHQLVEAQAKRTPDGVAAVFGPDQLTYRELDLQATQLAIHLRGLGVRPDTRVGLCVERSLDMLVGVLGVLKAGGCYVPLDPNYPADRLAFMLADAQASVVLTQRKLAGQFQKHQATLVCLDEPRPKVRAGDSFSSPVTADHLAYLIYTSGSTGRPKGVAMPHRPLVNLIAWQLRNSQAGRGSRTAQFTSLSFDVSFQEIFSTWCSGGTLVVVAQNLRRDPSGLWKLLCDARVERLFLPFVALQQLAEVAYESEITPRHLREVITAGEQLQATKKIIGMFEKLPGCTLHNHYGPSESHVVTSYTLQGPPRSWPTLPPIGRPISNTQVYILDAHGQPAMIGVPGELYIGGVCLAREYLNQPELTDVRFVWKTIGSKSERLYRTGDLARFLPAGNIEFLGRLDHQVKIRGFRVELGEIEDALRRHGKIRDSVVVAREVSPGDKRLAAYFTLRDSTTPSVTELREFLRGTLPDYMVPASFHAAEQFPLTPSGKVDRKAVSDLKSSSAGDEEKHTSARTPIEQTLVAIWQDVLNRKDVGIHDNFFDLGGHSLLAIRVIDNVHKAGLGLSLNQIFQHQTIAELANVAGTNQTIESGSDEWFSLVTLQPKGNKPPFFLVHTAPGDLLGYMKLVYHLGSDQPCYGFQSYGLQRQGASHERIEDMAAHYVRLLREFQPEGPYYLGGWCFGGNVAVEMAWQLIQQGQQVAAVVVMEGWAHRPPRRYWRYYLHRFVCLLKRGPHGVVRRYLGKIGRYFGKGDEAQERRAEFAFEAARSGPLVNREYVYQMNLRATGKYLSRPAQYPGRITLFVRENFGDGKIISPDCGFATLARETRTYMVPGDHVGVLKEPHVKYLAEKLKECLTEAQSASSRHGASQS